MKAGSWREGRDLVNNLGREWLTLAKAAGLVDDDGKATASPHDLRRTCITNWARRLPIRVVQELAGHVNMSTTAQFYLAVTDADLEVARQAVEDSFRRIG